VAEIKRNFHISESIVNLFADAQGVELGVFSVPINVR
jgi:hypothetical protein